MAFSAETIKRAWDRAGGGCGCKRVDHPHGRPHDDPLIFADRGGTKGFDYAEFRKGLEFFADPDSWLVCKRGCRGGQGGPPWCPRECCKEHQVGLCFECAEFPCSKVGGNEAMIARGREYRRLGRSEWLLRQTEKADQGFEGHTGKCYQVCTGKQ